MLHKCGFETVCDGAGLFIIKFEVDTQIASTYNRI